MTTLPEGENRRNARADRLRTCVEFDMILDFAGGNVELDRIVGFDVWIRVANGSRIVCDEKGYFLGTHSK